MDKLEKALAKIADMRSQIEESSLDDAVKQRRLEMCDQERQKVVDAMEARSQQFAAAAKQAAAALKKAQAE